MGCPRCGGPVVAYQLGGSEASVCERCGYVGVSTELRGDADSGESWEAALERFYERHTEG